MPNMLPINNGPPIWFVMLPAQRAVDHWKLSPPFSVDLTWWKHGIKTNAVVRRSSRKDNRETPSENHFTIMPFSTETRISKRYLWRRWHAPPALGQERGKCSTYQAKTNWIFISTIYSSRMLTLFFRSFLVLSLQIVRWWVVSPFFLGCGSAGTTYDRFQQTPENSSCVMKLVLKVETLPAARV